MPTTNSENTPESDQPPRRGKRTAQIVIPSACLLAISITIALVISSGSDPSAKPLKAGHDVCTIQTLAEFHTENRTIDIDAVARTAHQGLNTITGVAATTLRPREQVFLAFKAAVEQGKTPELAKLLRVEAFDPQVWIVTTGDQAEAEIAAHLIQHRADRTSVRSSVTNPCVPETAVPTS